MTKYLCVKLMVQDVLSGATLFETQTGASDRMSWELGWIDEHSIELKSSDIGDTCWAEGNNGTWQNSPCPP